MNYPGILPIGATLAEGWRLFCAGLVRAFPWILAAEMLPLLEMSTTPKSVLNEDLGQFFNPLHLGLALSVGCLQALLYGIAIIQLARLANNDEFTPLLAAVRSIPALLIGYLIYELIVFLGLGIALLLFLPTALFIGVTVGVLVTLIPLAPTAYISTALALFAYPAVLERKGPFAALTRSAQLTRSNWGRAALVISIPAIVLLAIAAGNEIPFIEGLHTAMQQLANRSSGLDISQLQNLLSNPKISGHAAQPVGWTILFSVLTAFGWWYTLAVCYAEYRELSRSLAH